MDLTLSLKPEPKEEANDNELATLIARIEAQYGAFREVTEETLLEEIAKGPAFADQDIEKGEGETEENAVEKKKALEEARMKLLGLVHSAHMEAATALDYVCLLISGYSAEMGAQSMSPELRNFVPVGSLTMEKIVSEHPKEEIEEDKQLARGWKMDGLQSASDALKKAAVRLEAESTKEGRFWEQVIKVQEEGWAISRVGKERALAVRYGFIEATNEFKNRGISLLRRGDEGEIIVSEIGISAGKDRTLRVRVVDGDKILGTSIAPKKTDSKSVLTDTIEKSRDSLWEEELFFEIMRESRTLAGYGVASSETAITLDIDDGRKAIIDMVPRADIPEVTDGEEKTEKALAVAIRLALNLLLTQAHKFHLRIRSRPPPPLGQQKNQTINLPLLRPIIIYISHQTALRSLTTILKRTTALCKSTGFSASVNLQPFKMLTDQSTKEDEFSPLEPFLVNLESSATLNLPREFVVSIQARTMLGSQMPASGTSTIFSTSVTISDGDAAPFPKNQFSEVAELKSYLLWCLEMALVRAVRASDSVWEPTAQANEICRIIKTEETTKSKGVKIMVESEQRLVVKSGFVGDPATTDVIWDGRVQRDLQKHLNKNEVS